MKRAPFSFPTVPNTTEDARIYADSAAKRGKRLGKLYAKLLSQRGFVKGQILDAGCGSGEVPIELARAFPEVEVVGLDLSEPLLEIARSSTEKFGLSNRVSYKKGDAQAMPFKDDSFDVVVSLNTLHVVDDPVAMLNEIERAMVPKGIFMLGNIKRSWFGYIMPVLKTAYTADEVKEILSRSKLRPCKFKEHFLYIAVWTESQ